MKLAKVPNLIVLGTILSLAAIGCRKGLDKTTQIPKGSSPTIGDTGTGQPRDITPSPPVNTTSTDSTPTGVKGSDVPSNSNIAANTTDRSTWLENRDEFKAQTVYFDFDKSNIKPSEVGKLEEVAKRMKSSFQGKALRVEGHCDERGTEEYNRSLGDKRAQSGREKLAQLGLDPGLVDTISFGEEKPADPGHNDAAWKKNRRIELILLSPPPAGAAN
jgi:peptidoglycan-associated lipoprotein